MNGLIRGLRVIDPLTGTDARNQDVRVENGRITAIGPGLHAESLPVVDLTPSPGADPCVLCPGFIDLHVHLREPGDEHAETVESGTRAAAVGGFVKVVAMANTRPVVDTPERVAAVVARGSGGSVGVLPVAALTRGLAGDELVDIEACAAAGAVAFSDDGRNAAPAALLTAGLRAAAAVDRPVLVHAEDESLIAGANEPGHPVTTCSSRPVEAEVAAVDTAITALRRAGQGRLHLQHLSAAPSLLLLRRARAQGLRVTAEVTPHHIAMSLPLDVDPHPRALAKVNPPLRATADRNALVAALRDGVVDAIATDHAPHAAAAKDAEFDAAPPGMVGLETALGVCLGAVPGDPDWLPLVVRSLTHGPHRVLDGATPTPGPGLRLGQLATCVIFDPGLEWRVDRDTLSSRSWNTPLLGRRLRGRVLLTAVDGVVVHCASDRVRGIQESARV